MRSHKKRILAPVKIINDEEYYTCSDCHSLLQRKYFNKKVKDGCKKCIALKNHTYRSTPRGHIKTLINHAKFSLKRLQKRDRKMSMNINYDFIVDLLKKQNYRCVYSNIILNFGSYLNNDWICSIERINPNIGYMKNNVCLICLEFNTSIRISKYFEIEEIGNSGWNREKFEYLKKNIE